MISQFQDHEMALDTDVAEAVEINAHNDSSSQTRMPQDPPDLSEDDDDDATLDASLAALTSSLAPSPSAPQHQLYQQPRSTQNKLSSQTRALYKKYAQHGSMIRLSSQL